MVSQVIVVGTDREEADGSGGCSRTATRLAWIVATALRSVPTPTWVTPTSMGTPHHGANIRQYGNGERDSRPLGGP